MKDKIRRRVSIFTSDDYTWSFATWVKTIPELIKKYEVVGIYLFPEKLGKMKGIQIPLWHLRIFGLFNSVILGLYAIKVRLLQLASQTKTWEQLASRYNIKLNRGQSPNSKIVCDWVKENDIDIIFIMVGDILKEDIVKSPNIGIINKHAAILPSCKGILPFFWAKLNNLPIGVTFHQVDIGVDTGRILIQMPHPLKDSSDISMLRFYIDVFYFFPFMVPLAAEHLIKKIYHRPSVNVKSSYFSFPTKTDFKKYAAKGYEVAKISDLLYIPDFPIGEVKKHEICSNRY